MKKLLKTKIALLFLLIGLAFACKKTDNTTMDPAYETDTIQTTIDTVGPEVDTTDMNGKAGTTGATGEGSTGSGTAGSTQKANTNAQKDSIK